jgi:hypothetical protein
MYLLQYVIIIIAGLNYKLKNIITYNNNYNKYINIIQAFNC